MDVVKRAVLLCAVSVGMLALVCVPFDVFVDLGDDCVGIQFGAMFYINDLFPDHQIDTHVSAWPPSLWRLEPLTPRYYRYGSWTIPLYIPAMVLALVWLLWHLAGHRKPRAIGFCVECDYDWTGNTSGVCPECGVPTSRSDSAALNAQRRLYCRECDRLLTKGSSCCPECGATLVLSTPSTYRRSRRRPLCALAACLAAWLGMGLLLLAGRHVGYVAAVVSADVALLLGTVGIGLVGLGFLLTGIRVAVAVTKRRGDPPGVIEIIAGVGALLGVVATGTTIVRAIDGA